ncbi:hypothetical protein FQN54_007186 [Arachnomyces sp. PD_36]|nr:hypothetical protein FQN54_007186 [Arachnomyces sp. PD_36]
MGLTKLLLGTSSSSSGHQNSYSPSQYTHILTFRPSPQQKDTTLVERLDPHTGTKSPIFTCSSKSSKPQIQVSRILTNPHTRQQTTVLAGTATFHTFSSTVDIALPPQNQHFPMKSSQMSISSAYGFTCPTMGKFKWGEGSSGSGFSSSFELQDCGTGQTVARYGKDKSAGGGSGWSAMMSGNKRMEIMVPCGDFFLDVAVLTVLVAAKLKSGDNEVAGEVISAVVGM